MVEQCFHTQKKMYEYKIRIKILLICFLLSSNVLGFGQMLKPDEFVNPSAQYHVATWWHWMNGYITKEGITKDLEAMKAQGVLNATILNVYRPFTADVNSHIVVEAAEEVDPSQGIPPLMKNWHQVKFGSNEWYELFQYALSEAERLGMKIGAANCDGWSESGGPWITPEMSMKQFTWSKNYVEGGRKVEVQLVQPTARNNYYEDAYVVAFRSKGANSFDMAQPNITCKGGRSAKILNDGNPNTGLALRNDSLLFSFDRPFMTEVLRIFWWKTGKLNVQPIHLRLDVSDDGVSFRHIISLQIKEMSNLLKLSIPKTTAKYFKLTVEDSNKDTFIGEAYLLKKGELGLFESNYSNYSIKTSAVRAQKMEDFWAENEMLEENAIKTIDEIIDITDKMDTDGLLTWDAPQGIWTIIRFGYTTTGKTNHPASPEGRGLECDKMDTTALNFHFSHYPQKLIEKAGKHVGSTFSYFLVDSWEAGLQNWTKNFAKEFENRRGYSIVPYIPVLCGEILCDNECTEAFLHDFRLTIGDLILENYFKHLSTLCHREGMLLYSEGIYGDELTPPVDVLQTYKYCDVPMTEFWAKIQAHHWPFPVKLSECKGFVMPEHSALLYNKPVIASEAYTGYGIYSDSPIDLKLYGDQAFCEGVNSMVLHSYVHQIQDRRPGFTLGIYGQAFNRHNTWYKYARSFFDEQARVQYMMQNGFRCSDALIYVGDKKPAVECRSEELSHLLPDLNMKFNYCNQEVLLNNLFVKNGRLYLNNGASFQFLILRDIDMDLNTLQKVEELVKNGAIIYGRKPRRTLSLKNYDKNNAMLKCIADRMWYVNQQDTIHYGKGCIATSLKGLRLLYNPDVQCDDLDSIMYLHRKNNTADYYYIVNKSNLNHLNTCIKFRQKNKHISVWDPIDGCIYVKADSYWDGNYTSLPLSLRPRQSVFVVFSEENYYSKENYNGYCNIDTLVYTTANGNMTFEDDSIIGCIPIHSFNSLTESKDSLIKYYSGEVAYRFELKVPEKYFQKQNIFLLQIPAFGSTAHIEVNGKFIKTIWDPTEKLDITNYINKGSNMFVIRVTNPWRNRLIGDKIQNRGKKATWTTSPMIDKYDPVPVISKRSELIPSGISQPIYLYIGAFQE